MTDATRDWNAASARLEDYLRTQRIQDRRRLLAVTMELLEAARRRCGEAPAEPPLAVTMRIAIERIDEWFASLIEAAEESVARRAGRARLAYFAVEADRRWPDAFLRPDPPEELIAAVRGASVQAGPGLEFSSLLRKEINYGPMEDIARETWDQFSWGHVLRAFAIWMAIFFAVYGVYLYGFQ